MVTEEKIQTATIPAWTLQDEIPMPDDVQPLLTEGEQAVAAFKTFETVQSSRRTDLLPVGLTGFEPATP